VIRHRSDIIACTEEERRLAVAAPHCELLRSNKERVVLPFIPIDFLGTTVSTYPLVLAVYLLIALPVTAKLNASRGISPDVTLGAFAVGVPAGLIGAHVLDIFEYSDRYPQWTDVFRRGGGSSIYGAFILVLPVVAAYVRRHGVPLLRFMDGGAPAMALGEAMSRIGCFLNGCCYGVPTSRPWSIVFPAGSFAYRDQIARGLLSPNAFQSLPVHPVQLYSAIIMSATTALLLWILRRPRPDGTVLFAFLLIYGALRLGMSPYRQEALVSMKVFSIAFMLIGAAGLIGARKARPPDGDGIVS